MINPAAAHGKRRWPRNKTLCNDLGSDQGGLWNVVAGCYFAHGSHTVGNFLAGPYRHLNAIPFHLAEGGRVSERELKDET